MVSFGTVDTLVVFGSGPLVTEVIDVGGEYEFEIVVVTSPRQEPEVENRLDNLEVKLVVTPDVNEDDKVETLIDSQTLGISSSAAWIFEESLIETLDGALVNFHGARLPQDRGGGGFSWRILRDDSIGYAQVHLVVPEIDSGDIILSREFRYPESCTLPADYIERTTTAEAELLKELIQGVANGREFETTTQPDYLSSYWPRLSTDVHGYIDWDWELPEIVRFTRAFSDPYDGAKTFVRGTEVRLKQCTDQYSDGTFHPFQTGILYRMHEDRAHIATTEGTLIAGRVLNEDGDSVLENLSVGDRLYTPTEQLERARKTRAFVTPTGTRHDTK